jgi:NADH-quinone oxidoreductase subunit N
VALAQRDIKRMLAYSSINHAGFVLLGLQVATARGVEGSLYYLFVYTFMVIGAFAVVTVVGGRGDTDHDLDRYRGLAVGHPWLAGSLAVFLMAQAGIPFTTGFLAKLEVISASVGGRSTALAVIAMVSAAIAAFFYLRVILLMYSGSAAYRSDAAGASSPPAAEAAPASTGSASDLAGSGSPGEAPATLTLVEGSAADLGRSSPVDGATAAAIALCVAVTVLFGLWPAPVVDFAHKATLLFR